MELRYLHSSGTVSLEPDLIDESSGGISWGIPEERTAGESSWLFKGPEGSRVGTVVGYEVGAE